MNSLEAENRSRGKRGQPPLTYNEAFAMLNQLVGGDVLSACQSANLRWDLFSEAVFEEGYRIPRIESHPYKGQRTNHRNESRHSEGQRRGGKGGSYGRLTKGNKNFPRNKGKSVDSLCKDFNSPSGCRQSLATRSIISVGVCMETSSATRKPMVIQPAMITTKLSMI